MKTMLWFIGASWPELILGLAVRLFIILAILPIHEYAHARMAYKLGDSTAKNMGRLTLNPLAHVDYIGAGLLILFGFGWAKAVPVNPYRFNNQSKRKQGMALTALAGPVSNIIVAAVALLIFRIVAIFPIEYDKAIWIYLAFDLLISINIGLAVFNLLPVYPLDGSRILAAVLPDKWNDFMNKNSQMITMVTMILVFVGVLDPVISFLRNGLMDGMTFCINGLFNLVGLDVADIWSSIF